MRQVAIDPTAAKPFRGLNLHGAYLAGLELGCDKDAGRSPTNCAELVDADLGDALLYGTDLTGARMSGADLRGANLFTADVSDAVLTDADLRGAYLASADLRGANLTRAKLSGANLQVVCYDDKTQWPEGAPRPKPDCRGWSSI